MHLSDISIDLSHLPGGRTGVGVCAPTAAAAAADAAAVGVGLRYLADRACRLIALSSRRLLPGPDPTAARSPNANTRPPLGPRRRRLLYCRSPARSALRVVRRRSNLFPFSRRHSGDDFAPNRRALFVFRPRFRRRVARVVRRCWQFSPDGAAEAFRRSLIIKFRFGFRRLPFVRQFS